MAYIFAMSFGLFTLYNLVSQSLYANQEQTPSPVSKVSENEPVKNLRTAGNSQIAQRLTERNSVASSESPSPHSTEAESTCYCVPPSLVNPNIRETDTGNTALHYAVQSGQIELVKLLLQMGMDINATNNKGESPLHFASSANQPQIIKFLLEKGANVNARDLAGKTALHSAVINEQKDAIDFLLWCGADIHAKDFDGYSILYYAAKNSLKELVRRLWGKGAKIQTNELPGNLDSKGISLLYFAAAELDQLDADLVEFFIDHAKMHPNAKNEEGNTPLYLAINKGNMPIALILLKKGADATTINSAGWTLLHAAVQQGNPLVVEFVLNQAGVDINAQSQDKKTALHLAAEKVHPNPRIVELLVQKGANVHLRDRDKSTALHFAAQTGNPTIVLILLSRIADVNAANELEMTPLHLAVDKGNIEIARLLLQHEDVKVDATNNYGRTALHIAARNGNRPMVELLLKHNANIHVVDFEGYTLRQLAIRADIRAEIRDLLEQKEKASPLQT